MNGHTAQRERQRQRQRQRQSEEGRNGTSKTRKEKTGKIKDKKEKRYEQMRIRPGEKHSTSDEVLPKKGLSNCSFSKVCQSGDRGRFSTLP